MKIKEYIQRIVDNDKQEDMEELSDMLEELLYKIKEYDKECYDYYKMELLGMAYNYKFDEEIAKEIVNNMRPIGQQWNLEQTTQVRRQYDVDVDNIDFYIVMNSMANDYGKIIDTNEVEIYARMSYAFIKDEDSSKNKVWKYYTTIAKI